MYTTGAATMRTTRIKAAKQIHEQKKKSGTLQSDAVFEAADVDLTNTIDGESHSLLRRLGDGEQRRRDLRHARAHDGLCGCVAHGAFLLETIASGAVSSRCGQ